jgi:hypothetical protein
LGLSFRIRTEILIIVEKVVIIIAMIKINKFNTNMFENMIIIIMGHKNNMKIVDIMDLRIVFRILLILIVIMIVKKMKIYIIIVAKEIIGLVKIIITTKYNYQEIPNLLSRKTLIIIPFFLSKIKKLNL